MKANCSLTMSAHLKMSTRLQNNNALWSKRLQKKLVQNGEAADRLRRRRCATRSFDSLRLLTPSSRGTENLAANFSSRRTRRARGLASATSPRTPTGARGCGHYTQVVWANTKRVGCAAAECRNGGTFVVCSYDPPGNMDGRASSRCGGVLGANSSSAAGMFICDNACAMNEILLKSIVCVYQFVAVCAMMGVITSICRLSLSDPQLK